jgi:hypothetical protein
MLLLYVDDILIVGKNICRIVVNFFGLAKCILDKRIGRDRKSNKLYLSQERYTMKVLQNFKMDRVRGNGLSTCISFQVE